MSTCPKIEEELIGGNNIETKVSGAEVIRVTHSYSDSKKPWYHRWFTKFIAIFTTDEQKQKALCQVAGISHKTATEKLFAEIIKDVKYFYKTIKHYVIFYMLYSMVRLNIIGEQTFLRYCFSKH